MNNFLVWSARLFFLGRGFIGGNKTLISAIMSFLISYRRRQRRDTADTGKRCYSTWPPTTI